MRIVYVTKIISIVLGVVLILMAVSQYMNMSAFSVALAQYPNLAENTRLIAVVFIVLEFLAGVTLVAGSGSAKVFSSAANVALVVILGWLILGAIAIRNNVVISNWALFGEFVVWPVSFWTEAILLVFAIATLFLALQALYLKNRRGIW
jgi:hypothetical protein